MSTTLDRGAARRARGRCRPPGRGSGRRSQDLLPLALRQAAPDPVRLMHLERMPTAFQQGGAAGADRLRFRFTSGARRPTFTLGVEEIGTGHPAARGMQLPVPQIGVGPRKAPGVGHHVPLLDLGRPDARTTDEGEGSHRGVAPLQRTSLLPPDPPRCRGCSYLDHRSATDHDQGPRRAAVDPPATSGPKDRHGRSNTGRRIGYIPSWRQIVASAGRARVGRTAEGPLPSEGSRVRERSRDWCAVTGERSVARDDRLGV